MEPLLKIHVSSKKSGSNSCSDLILKYSLKNLARAAAMCDCSKNPLLSSSIVNLNPIEVSSEFKLVFLNWKISSSFNLSIRLLIVTGNTRMYGINNILGLYGTAQQLTSFVKC